MYRNTYIHTYIHTYIRTYVHTYIHTYIHTATLHEPPCIPCVIHFRGRSISGNSQKTKSNNLGSWGYTRPCQFMGHKKLRPQKGLSRRRSLRLFVLEGRALLGILGASQRLQGNCSFGGCIWRGKLSHEPENRRPFTQN